MNIEDIMIALENARRVAGVGRFSLTTEAGDGATPCLVSHWFRTGRYGFEDTKVIAMGSLADCLHALDVYARHFRSTHWTNEAVARTLGIPTPSPVQPAIAAE